jgi:ADP-heptose:LPS heptosyltransferase
MLAEFGLGRQDTYVVLHTGARLKFSRWPGYGELAKLILARTGHKVVMMADEPDYRGTLASGLLNSPRFQLMDRRLSFDQFDALLSFCAGFVGNDSGPKHLASLRGAAVVAIHLGRNNWSEWGQENTGFVISRRVPCAGCSLHHDPEECGKDFACITNVKAEEVYGALQRAMRGEA